MNCPPKCILFVCSESYIVLYTFAVWSYRLGWVEMCTWKGVCVCVGGGLAYIDFHLISSQFQSRTTSWEQQKLLVGPLFQIPIFLLYRITGAFKVRPTWCGCLGYEKVSLYWEPPYNRTSVCLVRYTVRHYRPFVELVPTASLYENHLIIN